jgi:hypothetical protein
VLSPPFGCGKILLTNDFRDALGLVTGLSRANFQFAIRMQRLCAQPLLPACVVTRAQTPA